MGLTPTYKISANSQDITDKIADRFMGLRLTDEAGLQSDALELTLADHDSDNAINLPDTGAELEVWLGYDGSSTYKGLFVVDEVELAGPPSRMIIRAKAAPQDDSSQGKTSLQTQKTRSWETGLLLSSLVKTVAADHGMDYAVATSLATITLPHIDQVNESDINLLTRVAANYDAIAKPAGGKIIIAKRGESKSVSGLSLPSTTLTPLDVTSWRTVINRRVLATKVVAVYRDLLTAQDVEVSTGTGSTVKRLRHTYPDEATATKAARSAYDKSQREGTTLTVTLPGDENLLAEGGVTMEDFRDGVNGDWTITRVEHSITSAGYRCAFEADTADT